MKGIFVTGTDTGVGKTIITGFLGRYLNECGLNVITQKWIESGSSDIKTHFKLLKKMPDIPKHYLCPYSFRFPASCHLAARIENTKIKKAIIKKAFEFLKERFSLVIVEGSGGLLVPITRKIFLIDIARELSLPVLVVSRNCLGAINHTLLTIEALKKRKMEILGIVFINKKHEKKEILEDNPMIIKELTKVNIFGAIPFIKEKEVLFKAFIPIGEKIKAMLFNV